MNDRYRMSIRLDRELKDFLIEIRNRAAAEGKKISLNEALCNVLRWARENTDTSGMTTRSDLIFKRAIGE